MTDRKANILEGIGLLLILFSFFIQLIEMNIEGEVREAQFAQTQLKLDQLWTVVSDDYSEKRPEHGVSKAIDLKAIEKGWKYYSQEKEELSEWEKSVLYGAISKWRIWVFILGSVLILIPKFTKRKI
ncbi:hypothetical protein ACTJIJ_24675 [Niabella sp. 22666]|uniref:hypothetical protein n=1 Tax=Niabella sp. 22666 TaxID=3453954 RepID=UPI003F82B7B3